MNAFFFQMVMLLEVPKNWMPVEYWVPFYTVLVFGDEVRNIIINDKLPYSLRPGPA